MESILEQEKPKLELRFDPSTIEDLGIKMYSRLPSALAELVANAYDAAAENVKIRLYDNGEDKRIEVEDDGDGMSYEDIQDKFLRIGRKQRKEGAPRENSKNRRITGKKGLGKLALFGIGKVITIKSSRRGDKESTEFVLNWDNIINGDSNNNNANRLENEHNRVYNPDTTIIKKNNSDEHGTTIILTELTRASGFDLEAISISLSKMFNCLGNDFKVEISLNDDKETKVLLTRELRYKNVEKQFTWDVGKIISSIDSEFEHKEKLRGTIISTRYPSRSDLRGICLYANGRLVNNPGFFGLPEAEHVYSYLSGWIDADYIDEFEEDLTSTDRQSLNWDMPEAEKLQQFLQKLVKKVASEWNNKRVEEKKKKQKIITGIDVDKWKGTLSDTMKTSVEKTLESLDSINNLDDNEYGKVVKEIHELIPDYAQYHFRCLNKKVQDVSRKSYEGGDYYNAISQACIAYIDEIKMQIRQKDPDAKFDENDRNLFGRAFGQEERKEFHVFAGAIRPNGQPFEQTTINNLEDAQRLLSEGVYTGYRDPLAHNTSIDLKDANLISEQNCLDALSLISMLFDRLGRATENGTGNQS